MGFAKEKQVIRWGILGCGNVTEAKSGPAFQKSRGSELVAVMRRNEDLARQYAMRHGVPSWYQDADALIRDDQVDAIYIATPVGSHAQLALKVAAAGKPAYLEKPMARHAPECARIIEAFRKKDVPLFVAYYRRCLPRFTRIAALIGDGVLGRLTGIRYHYGSPSHRTQTTPLPWRFDAVQSGGGLFLDLGCHALDILDFLVGPLRNVSGTARNVASQHAVEDTVAMSFEVLDGIPGIASWNFSRNERVDQLELAGTEGCLSFSVFGDTPIRVDRRDQTQLIEAGNPDPIQGPLIQCMVDTLMGHGNCPSTGESALRTSLVMDKVLDNYYGGREDAFWERMETWPGRTVP